MLILQILVGVVFGIMVALAICLRHLSARLGVAERLLAARPAALLPTEPLRPLEGLRFAIAVEQDHPRSVFATLLKETLLREEAEIVDEAAADVLIRGKLLCNGYAEIYYEADFTVGSFGEVLLALAEKPPHGDRQGNLALEIVTRLKAEWTVRGRRNALRELREPL